MNQIATGMTADPQLLQQILKGTGGSVSVRNSDYNRTQQQPPVLKASGQKGGANQSQMTNPFLLGKNSTQKMTPGSTKGSQTNRFPTSTTTSNNKQILFELMQSQDA